MLISVELEHLPVLVWLTACTRSRPDSTCPCWTTQNHSWPPQERETPASRNSPAASLWADTWREPAALNSDAFSFLNKDISAVSTYFLASPKSMILTLFVSLLTHRMFSGCRTQETARVMKVTVVICFKTRGMSAVLLLWGPLTDQSVFIVHHTGSLLVPLGPDGGCTFCACSASLHRSAWWTSPCRAPSAYSSHRWFCRRVHLHQHCSERSAQNQFNSLCNPYLWLQATHHQKY